MARRKMTGRKRGSRQRIGGFFRCCLLLTAGTVLGLNIYLFNANYIAGNSMPMPFGYGAAVVLSGSMEPTLSVNDLIFVKEEERYEPGDVVVYQDQQALIVHRLISIEGDRITTQGDANNAADPSADRASIKGRVIGSVPAIGGFLRMLRTPAGMLCLLAAAVFLLERSYWEERRKDNEKMEQIKREIRQLKAEKINQENPNKEGGGE